MRAGDFVGAKIYRKPTEDKRTKKDGTPRSPKKLGKIHFPVFTPGGTRVVGFMAVSYTHLGKNAVWSAVPDFAAYFRK